MSEKLGKIRKASIICMLCMVWYDAEVNLPPNTTQYISDKVNIGIHVLTLTIGLNGVKFVLNKIHIIRSRSRI